MGIRVVSGLRWARMLDSRPEFIPKNRPRGVKAKGCQYEGQVAKALPSMTRGQWWEFEDRNGPGWCQTDLFTKCQGRALVLECKLTWTQDGHWQLERLYRPVVEMALGMEMVGIEVAKRLLPGMPKRLCVCQELETAVISAVEGRATVLHWIGKSELNLPTWPVQHATAA